MLTSKFSERIKSLQPLFIICGCTGTGKSDLGIELAKHFNGEVINADSMQIYKGLDIATNKVTTEEMQGVTHHLMSFCDPCESNYNVHHYRNAVLPLIERLWANGKLPIIVGGTGYYMEAAIYYDNLVQTNAQKSDDLRNELLQKFPTCDLLHEELKRVDPKSAGEVHKNAKSKVLRALEIFYSTGQTKSEHHKMQREGQAANFHLAGRLRTKNTLLFTLDADKEVLSQRLNSRVDGMLKRGLIEELDSFYTEHQNQLNSFGILQCIGLKEFLPYLQLTEKERQAEIGQKILKECVDLVKLHTRRYAKTQRKWFYNRIHLREKYREVPYSIALNTSSHFHEDVVPFAIDVAERFLSGRCINDISPENPTILMPLPAASELFDLPDYAQLKQMKHCGICDIMAEFSQWKNHLKGKRHRSATSNLIYDLSRQLSGRRRGEEALSGAPLTDG
uniref:Isopentenyltransferase n=1 Tax=Heterodera schachtii TaxID=97005 RepID=A0A0N9RU45_HETSC|nr:isopentenyltransferase [Heterodera schachtii]